MRKFLSLAISLSSNVVESVTARATKVSLLHKECLVPYFLTVRTMGSVICKNSPTEGNKKKQVAMDSSTEYVEDIVCQEDDVKENEMKAFDLQDIGKVLIVRQNGKLSALGNKCTHYGAPLEKGALGQGRIRCQWHGACFNIMTGDIEDFPGLDSLPCYQVTIENKNVKVRAKKSELESSKRIKSMAEQDSRESTHMVVIGGGPSGAVCVETLRQEGFTGRITLINKENCLPYDRIKVSKTLDLDIKKVQLRSEDFYSEYNIEVLVNTEATKLDTASKKVTLSSGTVLDYDCVYVATGSKARKLEIPGGDLPQVCVLRGFEDSEYLYGLLAEEKNVVCLGFGFIGMEAAASCVNKVKSVTVVGRDSAPFKSVFGEDAGKRVMRLFEEKGVKFVTNSGLKQCIGDGKLTAVELVDGTRLPADILVIGLGSTFYTDFLKSSAVERNADGSVTVNEFMETNVKGVFAGGDIAKAPVYSSDNAKATIGHYPLAHYHGKIAALNMLGKSTPAKAVPFFWTMLFGKSLRYAGHGRHDEIKIVGNMEELKYFAFHFKGDRVIAMSSCQHDPIVSQYANLLAEGRQLYRKDVEADPLAWTK